jgi:branched-chain amino acid transport system ATP-binding protein
MLDATPTRETLLEVNNIEVIYNHVILVLKGVSLTVPKGGITALLGGNGAGKSTTLKAISNLLKSERGEVTKGSMLYRGQNTVQRPEPERSGEDGCDSGDGGAPLFRTPDGRGKPADRRLYPHHGKGADVARDLEMVYTYFPRLRERRKSPGGLYLGRRTADDGHRPRPDEPPRNDPAGRAQHGPCPAAGGTDFRNREEVNEKEGVTFLLAEQNTNVALRYAHYRLYP